MCKVKPRFSTAQVPSWPGPPGRMKHWPLSASPPARTSGPEFLDEARALEGAARCTVRMGDQAAALTDLSEAVAIYQHVGASEAGTATAYLATLESEVRDDVPLSNRPIPEQDR